jgi:sporulation protein YlmC with PRC-barrel domain
MRTPSTMISALAIVATLQTVPTFAQGTGPSHNPAPSAITGVPSNGPVVPPPAQQSPDRSTMNNGTAMTAGVHMMGNTRASKLIGMDVVNDKDQTIGKIDDILIGSNDKATAAVISVGGFIGIGAKLVAVPFDQLTPAPNDKKSLTMPNASKESLKSMPTFNYSNGA